MNFITKLKERVKNLPELSESNYQIACYIVCALITLSGLFLVYEVLFDGDLTFSAQWNIFKSPLGSVCIFIGFIWAMCWWGKFTHWSATPVVETRDRYSGRLIERKENYDVTEQMFAKILMPILGHFVIEPIMYGAVIYYPLQCIIALVGAIFPYVLSLLVLAIIGACWMYAQKVQIPARSWMLGLAGFVFTLAFAWGGYAIMNATPGGTIQMLADTNQMQYEPVSQEQTTTSGSGTADDDAAVGVEDEGEQFEGYGEEGLLGSLPEGTTSYEGEMAGFPIEFAITKDGDETTAKYTNVKYGTTMMLSGESLPAMGGNITFYGQEDGNDWRFELSGDGKNIEGTAYNGDKSLQVTLKKK